MPTEMTYRILLVEDNPHARDMFASAILRLRQEQEKLTAGLVHIELSEAHDGGDALKQLETQTVFHLLITDLGLPVMDGQSLIRRLRESGTFGALKILAVSSMGEDVRDEAMVAGADRFMSKPLRLAELCDALRDLLYLKKP